MTYTRVALDGQEIIPYQELLGNYDKMSSSAQVVNIIPYQELLGNYDCRADADLLLLIIPYQELLGNYDPGKLLPRRRDDYTIPRAIREL